MNQVRVPLFVVATFLLAGCSTIEVIFSNLFPAAKFLKGEIKNNIYTAKDNSFSVAVPHKDGSYEYTYMQVKEQYTEYGGHVSFGPAVLDQSIYHLKTVKRVTPGIKNMKFDDVAPIIIEAHKAQLQEIHYGTVLYETESRQETINGRKAYYWKLTQVVPAGKIISNRDVIFTNDVYFIDFEEGAAIVWVQVPDTTKKAAMEPRAFAESVVIY